MNLEEKKLDQVKIEWINIKSICVVLCSNGYPDTYKKNVKIDNIENIKLDKNNFLFHAGTIKNGKNIYAMGGRVLNFVSISDNFSDSKKNIIDNIERLNWPGGFYRKDIGYKVIK